MNVQTSILLRHMILIALVSAGCAAPPPALPPPIATPSKVDDVAAIERAFAATMANRDFKAFQSFIADDSIFITDQKTSRGKAAIVEAWKRYYEGPTAPFSWEPERVEILDSGSLALSSGPVRGRDGQVILFYSSVWRKDPMGWHVVFDRGVELPECPAPNSHESSAVPDLSAHRSLMKEAMAAYGRKDYAGFLTSTERAAQAQPNNPRAVYNLACGYALTGKPTEAIGQLEKLASMQLHFDISQDDDLKSLRELPAYKALLGTFGAVQTKVIGQSTSAFTLPDRDMLTEGIAHDPKTGAFFVSSVHQRAIVQISGPNKFKYFASKDLYGVLGMTVDETRRALWACSTAIPEMKGFGDADKGRAKLVEFDIDNGNVRHSFPLDEPGVPHMCNDVAVDRAGNVFVSDPAAGMIFSLPTGATALVPYLPPRKIAGPQGIALTTDGQSMFVADYAQGLFHVNRQTHEVTWISPPSNATLVGIDGLTMYKGDLIGIQNGITPHRVLRLQVDIPGKSVRRVDVLQMNHPAFVEPTLGAVVGKELFYVANSQWALFDKGVTPPMDKLQAPVILKLALE